MSRPVAGLTQTSGGDPPGKQVWVGGGLRRGSAGPDERGRRDHARGHGQEVRGPGIASSSN